MYELVSEKFSSAREWIKEYISNTDIGINSKGISPARIIGFSSL